MIKEQGGSFRGMVVSVEEDTAVVSHKIGAARQQAEIDLNDIELEIPVRKFSWLKIVALIGVSPFAGTLLYWMLDGYRFVH